VKSIWQKLIFLEDLLLWLTDVSYFVKNCLIYLENHNLISGNRLSLTLNDDNLIIKEGSRQFQMKSNCTLTQKNGSVQVDTVIENSHPQCKALISLVIV
jgi:hypothetical protein